MASLLRRVFVGLRKNQIPEMMLLGPAEIKGKPHHELIKLCLPTLVSTLVLSYTGLTKEHGPRSSEKFFLTTILY
jgi:hypothetical protein